jgi:hypothetical protein
MLDVNAIVARYRALPPPAKQLLMQQLTPQVLQVLVHVLGPEFIPVAQQFMQQGQMPDQGAPMPQPQPMQPQQQQQPPMASAFGNIA